MDLLRPNLMFLQQILRSEKDAFATTILQCFLQYVLQECGKEEAAPEIDSEDAACTVKTFVVAFASRTLDKTCAVRIAALQVPHYQSRCTYCHGYTTDQWHPPAVPCVLVTDACVRTKSESNIIIAWSRQD